MCYNNNSFKLNNKSNRMKKPLTQEKCFEINGIEYHLRLIPKFSRRWKDTGSSLKSLLMKFDGEYSCLEKRGKVEYNIGESSEVRKGRFEETHTDKNEMSSNYLTIKLMAKPRIKIISYSSYFDAGTEESKIITRQKTGFRKWGKVPSKELSCKEQLIYINP